MINSDSGSRVKLPYSSLIINNHQSLVSINLSILEGRNHAPFVSRCFLCWNRLSSGCNTVKAHDSILLTISDVGEKMTLLSARQVPVYDQVS